MEGWIKLHRKVLDNPVVCKDSDHIAVWNYILLNATHKEYQTFFCGKKITLVPGQLITGRKLISSKLKISESKVQRILKTFESEQQIEQQTSSECRLISLISWEEYQGGEQQDEQRVNNNRTTSEQQVNTIQECKNVKNVKKNNIYDSVDSKTVEERVREFGKTLAPFVAVYGKEMIRDFYDYWTEGNNKNTKVRFEMERTWDVQKRLARWSRNNFKKPATISEQVNPNKLQ
jgi:hypothetical protein